MMFVLSLLLLIFAVVMIYFIIKCFWNKKRYISFMKTMLKELENEQEKVTFLMLSLGGIHADLHQLKTRNITYKELQDMERILDSVNEYFETNDKKESGVKN